MALTSRQTAQGLFPSPPYDTDWWSRYTHSLAGEEEYYRVFPAKTRSELYNKMNKVIENEQQIL